MRVLKALRRTWRTLEQVEHFINCYTRSFFFFFFFLKEKKKKSAIITIIFRGNKMVETLREFRRHFAPAGVFQRVPSEICARQLGTSQLSRRHPLLSTHKTRKVFFCSNFVCDWDYPPTIFSKKKKNDRPTGSATAWGRCCCSGGYLVIFFSSTRCLCWRSLATKRCAATFPQNSVDFNLSRYLRLYLVKKVVK